jgi:hypothetical protein
VQRAVALPVLLVGELARLAELEKRRQAPQESKVLQLVSLAHPEPSEAQQQPVQRD